VLSRHLSRLGYIISDEQICVIFAALLLNLSNHVLHYNPLDITIIFSILPDLFSLYQHFIRSLIHSTGFKDKTTNTFTTRTWRPENYFCRVVKQSVEGYLV